jgi:NodT family efflux transporter outer membrane factor (OMF) lipoprotein
LEATYLATANDPEQVFAEATYWWSGFEDPVLNQLIAMACRQNLDLREAYLRVLEARYQVGVVQSGLFPQVNGLGAYTFRQSSDNAREFVPVGNASDAFALFRTGFDSSWEVDLFGRIRRSIEAGVADWEAVEQTRQFVKVTLLADVAWNYVNYRVLQQRVAIAEQNRESQGATRERIAQRLKVGAAPPLELSQADSNYYLTSAEIPDLMRQQRMVMNRLSVLLGEVPSQTLVEMLGEATIPRFHETLAVGLPGELLRSRPDIRQAERELAAASARIGVATADLYPRFTITGDFSVDTREINTLFATGSIAHSVGPSFSWNILNFRRIFSNIEVQRARYLQALARYQNAILRAVEEVENGIVSYRTEEDRLQLLRQAATTAKQYVDQAREGYATGIYNFLVVYDAERQLLAAQDRVALSEGALVASVIQTYKAIGGGWDADCRKELPVIDSSGPGVEEGPVLEEIEEPAESLPAPRLTSDLRVTAPSLIERR